MQPSTSGFHHVAKVTGDLAAATEFYGSVLGLPLLGDTPAPAPGTIIALVEAEPDAPHGQAGIGGIHHTAFGVPTEDELLMWKRRLTDLGWGVTGPYDRGYFTSIYFRDPDGQVLEIATSGPGYAIDEPADELGGELLLPPQRIVRGHRDEAAIAALTHQEPVPHITAAMSLDGIHHVTGITDDLERAGDFYEAAFGLRLIKKTINRDDPQQLHYFWARYDDGELAPHSAFTLFGWPSHWKKARAGRGQTHHVAFRARDDEELGAWEEHLRGMGVDVARNGSRLRFHAPDGQPLELVTDAT